MTTLAVVVTGHVQGVGYRDFVRRSALIFGVRGEVWNRADGAVEMVLEHEDGPHLNAFVKMLPEGPGWVDSVDAEPVQAGPFEGFRVGVTRP
jgi:acylphosphatase